jgi:hypothetical protein
MAGEMPAAVKKQRRKKPSERAETKVKVRARARGKPTPALIDILLSGENIALLSIIGIYIIRLPIGILEDFTYELMEMIDKKKLKQLPPNSKNINKTNMKVKKTKVKQKNFNVINFTEKFLLKLTEESAASCRTCYGALCPMSFVRYTAKNSYDTVKGIRELLERNL